MFDVALGLFLFLSPIFFLPFQVGEINALQFYQFGVLGNGRYNYLQLSFFCFAVAGLFIIALLSKPQREFNNKWIAVLLALFCINVYFHPIGVRMIAPILLGFLLYYLVVVYTKDYKKLFKFIFLASLVNTVFAILQFFNINLIFSTINTSKVYGLMYLSTHLGVYQAIVLPICYVINPWLIIVPLVGIILSKSIIAVAIAFIWCLIKFRRFFKASPILYLCLISIVGVFLIRNWDLIALKTTIRLNVWLPVIKDISHKLLGVGIKPFEINSTFGLFENTCSMYLGLIRWLGILVLIPIFMLIRQAWGFKNSVIASSVFIALLAGIEKSIMDYPRLAGTAIVLFGLLTVANGDKKLCV